MSTDHAQYIHDVSIVIPVYGGEITLAAVVSSILPYTDIHRSDDGQLFRVIEVLPVFDHGRDKSDVVIRGLAKQFDFVKPVWLSKNFGQHAATLAGMSSSTGAWVVTMDDDGQHNPKYIGDLIDCAIGSQADLVYADPISHAPHSVGRNLTSWGAKFVASKVLGLSEAPNYQSFRLMLGDVARLTSAYAGSGAYLDVALSWVANRVATCPLELQQEGREESSYTLSRLISHFWRMVITAGTRPIRMVSGLGFTTAVIGIIWAVVVFVLHFFDTTGDDVPGWTSLMIVLLIATGLILLSVGIVAEYVGASVNRAMGKPAFVVVPDPELGPLGAKVIKR